MPDYQMFEAGDVVPQSGLTYRQARMAYKTFGRLDAAKSNCWRAEHHPLSLRGGRRPATQSR